MAEVNIPDKAVARAQLAAKLTRTEFAAELHRIVADYLEELAGEWDAQVMAVHKETGEMDLGVGACVRALDRRVQQLREAQ